MTSKSRRQYLSKCLAQPAAWLDQCVKRPTDHMTPTHRLLVRVALRRLEHPAR